MRRTLTLALVLAAARRGAGPRRLRDRGPRLGPRRRDVAVRRLRLRARRGPRLPLHPRPLLHGHERRPGRDGPRIRVLLRRTREPKVCGATLLRDAGGRQVRLRDTRVYALLAVGRRRLQVVDTSNGHPRARARARAGDRRRVASASAAPPRTASAAAATAARCACTATRRARLVVNDLVARVLPAGRRRRGDAGHLARRGAQGPGRRRPLLRAAQPPPRRALRRLRRHPLAGLPRRRRRGRRPRPRPCAPPARSPSATASRSPRRSSTRPRAGARPATRRASAAALPVPYLRPVDDPYDDALARAHVDGPLDRPRGAAQARLGARGRPRRARGVGHDADRARVHGRRRSARRRTVPVTGAEIRRLLELRSTWFTIRRERDPLTNRVRTRFEPAHWTDPGSSGTLERGMTCAVQEHRDPDRDRPRRAGSSSCARRRHR